MLNDFFVDLYLELFENKPSCFYQKYEKVKLVEVYKKSKVLLTNVKTKCVWDEVPGVNANFKMFFSCSLIVLHRLITMGNYLLEL